MLHSNIQINIITGFVENDGRETQKQDCERKACYHLMKRLKEIFPMLPICLCADILYAYEPFFRNVMKTLEIFDSIQRSKYKKYL